MDTNESERMNGLFRKNLPFINKMSSSSLWPYYLTGVIVLVSEISTAFMNSINSLALPIDYSEVIFLLSIKESNLSQPILQMVVPNRGWARSP